VDFFKRRRGLCGRSGVRNWAVLLGSARPTCYLSRADVGWCGLQTRGQRWFGSRQVESRASVGPATKLVILWPAIIYMFYIYIYTYIYIYIYI
jgi:hypothetical protein